MGKSRPASIAGSARQYSAGRAGPEELSSAPVILIIMLIMVRERAVWSVELWPITNLSSILVCA